MLFTTLRYNRIREESILLIKSYLFDRTRTNFPNSIIRSFPSFYFGTYSLLDLYRAVGQMYRVLQLRTLKFIFPLIVVMLTKLVIKTTPIYLIFLTFAWTMA